ncbi:hypothetical protein LCGC14_0466780 [marine sediment metagenome]|uniref:10 kDa chaperonin n=1 Tax=marine sediment metagenome TaxID=412755 RepID=A0A0F9VMB1_9ZZZZ
MCELRETRLRPLGNRVVGRRLPEPDGSMIWTPAGSRKNYRCKVLAVGPKVDGVKVGETVLIGEYVDMDLENKVVIFQEADIRVVFND